MKKHIIAIYSKENKIFLGYICNAELACCRYAKDAKMFDAETTDTIIKALLPYYIVECF